MNTQDDFTRAKKVVSARIGFSIHLAAYLAVNALLIAINLATSTERLWFKWPLLCWGLGVFAHALVIFSLSRGSDIKGRMIERERRKRG